MRAKSMVTSFCHREPGNKCLQFIAQECRRKRLASGTIPAFTLANTAMSRLFSRLFFSIALLIFGVGAMAGEHALRRQRSMTLTPEQHEQMRQQMRDHWQERRSNLPPEERRQRRQELRQELRQRWQETPPEERQQLREQRRLWREQLQQRIAPAAAP